MPILLPNVSFDVYRSRYTVNAGTSAAQPYLAGQEGHMQNIPSRHMRMSQIASVNISYELRVEADLDIRIEDIIQNVVDLITGQAWVDMIDGTQTWRVIDAYNTTTGALGYRSLMLGRFIAGGPAPI